MSVVANRDRECFLCRLTSGCGLIGAGAYVAYQSNSQTHFMSQAKYLMRGFAGVLVILGTARVFNMGPFKTELPQQASG